MDARKKLATIIADLKSNFVERDDLIEALFALYLADQNAFLIGPPGTAKSALVEACAKAFNVGDKYFSYLMSNYTTDAEMFGMYSIDGMRSGRYSREMDGYLPNAKLAFLDEIMKANSSILNALLELLNERTFRNDGKKYKTPLRMVIGASNELPESGPQLKAMYDRMVARFYVDRVSSMDKRMDIITGAVSGEPSSTTLTAADTTALKKGVAAVTFSSGIRDLVKVILHTLEKDHGIEVTERRAKAIWKSLPAFAYVAGQDEVNDDTILATMPDMLWDEPKQRTAIYNVVAKLANPTAAKAQEILDAVHEIVATLPQHIDGKPDPTYAAAVLKAKDQIASAAEKLLKLDPNRVNGGVKKCSAELAKHYHDVMGRTMVIARLPAFHSDTTYKALTEY